MSDLLQQLLEEQNKKAAESGVVESAPTGAVDEGFDSLELSSILVGQNASQGDIWSSALVTNKDTDMVISRRGDDGYEIVGVIRKLKFLLLGEVAMVDPVTGVKTLPRRIKRYANGRYEELCKSANGVTPKQSFIGNTVYDDRTDSNVRIGENYQKADNGGISICESCPLGVWVGKRPPLCKQEPRYLIWVLKDQKILVENPDYDAASTDLDSDVKPFKVETIKEGFVAMVTGANASLQVGLTGKAAGQNMCRHDGEALPGIDVWFVPNGVYEGAYEAPADGAAGDVVPPIVRINAGLSPDDNVVKGQALAYKVPSYPYAPQGTPMESGNPDAPIYPVVMSLTKNMPTNPNAAKQNTLDFAIGAEPISAEAYAEYLSFLLGAFREDEYIKTLLGMKNSRPTTPMLEGGTPNQQQLPEAVDTSGGADDNVVDGDVEEIDIDDLLD
jgi:hypothetical protein